MERYTPKKLRPWTLTLWMLLGLIRLLELWPVVLLLAVFLSPVQPTMRVHYRYYPIGQSKAMTECDYLGLHGITHYRNSFNCPFILMIESPDQAETNKFLQHLQRILQ